MPTKDGSCDVAPDEAPSEEEAQRFLEMPGFCAAWAAQVLTGALELASAATIELGDAARIAGDVLGAAEWPPPKIQTRWFRGDDPTFYDEEVNPPPGPVGLIPYPFVGSSRIDPKALATAPQRAREERRASVKPAAKPRKKDRRSARHTQRRR